MTGRREFERLANEHMRALYGAIALRVPERDAPDVLQETLLSAYESFGSFDGRSSALTWLFSIARRRICDYYRSRSLDAPEVEAEPEGEDFTEASVEAVDMRTALARLSEGERELCTLIFRLGLDYAECAELVGIPVGTVKSRMFAVRAKLRKLLGEGYYEM